MERDKIYQLEMDVARLSRQVAGLPVRIAQSGGARPTGVLLTCEISTPIAAGTADTPVSGTGEVFDVDDAGDTTSRGSDKVIYNPFHHEVTGSCTCMEIATSDSYLLAGYDLLEALYLLTGAAEKTSLALPESASDPTDIQWLGGEC